jgi:hypothetical protein
MRHAAFAVHVFVRNFFFGGGAYIQNFHVKD